MIYFTINYKYDSIILGDNMNNKGFTLVEVISVIALLALIMIITMPAYNNIARAIRNQSLNSKQKSITSAMQNYAMSHLLDEIKPARTTSCSGTNCCCEYSIDFILDKGIYLPEQNGIIVDPLTSLELKGCVKIRYNLDTYRLDSVFDTACTTIANNTASKCTSTSICNSWPEGS